MTRPTPLVHSSILAARAFYAWRRAGFDAHFAHAKAARLVV